jgi:hypothetical protein
MELTITISDADIERLADAISARLVGATSVEVQPPLPREPAAPVAPAMSLGDLRGLARELVSKKGALGRDKLVAILGKSGAKNLTTLDEDKFDEVAKAIRGAM